MGSDEARMAGILSQQCLAIVSRQWQPGRSLTREREARTKSEDTMAGLATITARMASTCGGD